MKRRVGEVYLYPPIIWSIIEFYCDNTGIAQHWDIHAFLHFTYRFLLYTKHG